MGSERSDILERAAGLLKTLDAAIDKQEKAIAERIRAQDELIVCVQNEVENGEYVSDSDEAREAVREALADYVLDTLLKRGGGGLKR